MFILYESRIKLFLTLRPYVLEYCAWGQNYYVLVVFILQFLFSLNP